MDRNTDTEIYHVDLLTLKSSPFGLRWRFFFVTFVAFTSAAAVLGFFFLFSGRAQMEEAFFYSGRHLVRNLSYNAALGAVVGDKELMEQLTHGLLEEDDVAFVILLDTEKKILAEGYSRTGCPPPAELNQMLQSLQEGGCRTFASVKVVSNRRFYILSEPMIVSTSRLGDGVGKKRESSLYGEQVNREIVGVAIVCFCFTSLEEKFLKILEYFIAISVVVLIVGLIGSYLLAGTITVPVVDMASAALDIARGNLKRRVSIAGNTELATLGKAFNSMAFNLAERERELSTTNERLGVMVREKTIELQMKAQELERRNVILVKQNQEVKEANQLKAQFMANMSHELRTPLNAIIGFSKLLLSSAKDRLSQDELGDLSAIEGSGSRLLKIISQLLDFSKIEAGSTEIKFVRADVSRIIDDVCTELGLEAAENNLTLVVEKPDSLPLVMADEVMLWQIIENLVHNAVKFSTEGQVTISCRIRQGMIDNGEYPVQEYFELSVVDQGIGIEAGAISSIFEPFYQVDGSLSRAREGAGIGLSIVKRLVELHHGRISVESTVGIGSRFTFSIPVSSSGAEPSVVPESQVF